MTRDKGAGASTDLKAMLRPRIAPRSPMAGLMAEPHSHGFFQTVRLLERWLVQQENLTPEKALQRIRFHNSLALGFPASEVAELRFTPHEAAVGETSASDVSADGVPHPRTLASIDITPAFMGLLGGAGTLPTFYTELLAEREQVHKDGAGRAFMDIFLQRAATLLYQAWRKNRLALRFEQDRRRHFTPMLLSLAGIGQDALRDRLRAADGGVSDEALAHFAGRLQQRPVSVSNLKHVLSRYFDTPVKVEQFVGKWYLLGPENQSRLGMQACGLGSNALVGGRIWQRDQRVRLVLGPLTRTKLRRFLPGQPGAIALKEWLMLLTGLTVEYDIRLGLKCAEVTPSMLGGTSGAQLGYDSFLVTKTQSQDRYEPGYPLLAA